MERPIVLVARQLAAIALVAAWVTTAHAELSPYFGGPDNSKLSLNLALTERNEFLSTLIQSGAENLESLGGQVNPTLTFGDTGITAAIGFSNGVNTAFQYAVSGVNFLWDAEGANDWLEFSEPVTAFGSYIVQGGDGSSNPPTSTPPNTLTFRLENTELGTSKDVVIHDLGPDWPFYNVIFVGVTDTSPFNRVSFIESYDHDGLLWDDLVAGFVTPTLPGDFDKNDVVDGADLAVWSDHYQEIDNGAYLEGDADGDGDTDGKDFLVWQRQFGRTLENGGELPLVKSLAIPEPSAIMMAIFAILRLGVQRRP